jgi:LPS O-antigen subunit length determinant protein (WzzB/FepE family)
MQNPRTDASQKAYNNFKEQFAHKPELLRTFNLNDETVIREFTHWLIIENRFPYDRMTRTNHMLVAKRFYAHLHEGTDEEQKEYNNILRQLAEEGFYDALIENFPKVKSVKENAHVHLVQWHNTQPK